MTWEALIDVTYCQLSVVSIYIIVLRSKYQEHIKKNKIFLLSLDLWVFIEFVCHSHKDKYLVLSLFWLNYSYDQGLSEINYLSSGCIILHLWLIS